jgi:FAD/FMN-containing dehydrogenase
MAVQFSDETALLGRLEAICGPGFVQTSEEERAFYSQDVYRRGATAAAVVAPADTEQLAEVVRTATTAGYAVIARGGGMSYTDAYLPISSRTVIVDSRRLDRVLEINTDDNFVRVEAGCTWAALNSRLAEAGVRTPYWGPLSGIRATVGGALSQGSIFLGSGRYGTAQDSVLGLEVVIADGTRIVTGSAATGRAAPFFRYHGPDLTGLFTGDCGALGLKTAATLRLIRRPAATEFVSYSVADAASLFRAMAAIARAEVASEVFAFDPFLQSLRMRRASLTEDVKTLGKVIGSAGSVVRGLRDGVQLARAGRGFLDEVPYSLHVSVDGRDAADALGRLDRVREAVGGDAAEIENAVPKVMRANPFAEVNSMLGPEGERWAPVHGIVPLSRAAELHARLEALFERHASEAGTLGVSHGYLYCAISNHALLVEPCLYWPGERTSFHERVMDEAHLRRLPKGSDNPEASALVACLKEEIADLLHESGATSFQIGKFYRYRKGRDPGAWALLSAIKRQVDPQGMINPGVLGLA